MRSDTQTAGPPRDWKRTVKRFLITLLLTPLFLFAVYFVVVMNWNYSEGERAGYLQKFSRKGWICKTYEGELAMTTIPGTAPVIWDFSVWDEKVAKNMNGLLGRKVILHYKDYRNLPTDCFGATAFFVDAVVLQTE
jgi:hypothetical protein